MSQMESDWNGRIPALDQAAGQAADAHWQTLAKPPGSLGRLEAVVTQLAAIQGQAKPRVDQAVVFLFAADHGLSDAGVSAWPNSVTGAMLTTFAAGKAAINQICQTQGLALTPVDAGVRHRPAERFYRAGPDVPYPVRDLSMGPGTANSLNGPAMSRASAMDAMTRAGDLLASQGQGADLVGLGEMGIGNTAAASLITHALSGRPLADCVGRGAGQDSDGLARKRDCLAQVVNAGPMPEEPLEILARFGGYEIAMMVGATLAAARRRQAVLVDGFIATAAVALACEIQATTRNYCIFCHESAEPGHRFLLDHLGAQPLLDLSMALGEGSGAALAVPLIRSAVACHAGMDSIETVLARQAEDQGEDWGEDRNDHASS